VSAMGRLLEGGLLRLADSEAPADAAAAARLLPRVVHLMVPLVRSADALGGDRSGGLLVVALAALAGPWFESCLQHN
jgi:hypothetical protein